MSDRKPVPSPSLRALTFTLTQVNEALNEHYTRVRADLDSVTEFYASTVRETVESQIAAKDAERQKVEDSRANHRNFNRMLTLIGALLIGLVVTFVLTHGYLGHFGLVLAPYSFVITVLLDTSLAAYSYIKRY